MQQASPQAGKSKLEGVKEDLKVPPARGQPRWRWPTLIPMPCPPRAGPPAQVLKSIWFSKVSGDDHAERLESFYGPQAELCEQPAHHVF